MSPQLSRSVCGTALPLFPPCQPLKRISRSLFTTLLLLGFTCAGVLLSAGCASLMETPRVHEAVPPDEFGKQYSPDELRSDVDFLVRTLQNVHPNLFAFTPKSRFDSARWQIKRELTVPMTRGEFYGRIAPLVALVGDGHTNVTPPVEEFSSYQAEGGRVFPFLVDYSAADGVILTRCYGDVSGLVPGDRIERINGLSMDSLAFRFQQGLSGERASYRAQRVGSWLPLLLWLNNVNPPYDLVVQLRGSHDRTICRTSGVTPAEMRRQDSLTTRQGGSSPPYRFSRLGDDIGYVEFRSMVNLDRFNEFLSVTFTHLKQHPPSGLIIDLRNNGGGDSRLGDALLSFLTDSSFRGAQRKEWKMSAEEKSYLLRHLPWWIRWMPLTWVSAEARKYLGAEDGAIVVDTSDLMKPDSNDLRFRGRTCFLIGPRTFSSAMMLANAVADYHLATLIGEETGGIPNAYGEVYPFDLPNTKLLVGVSSAFFVRANGDSRNPHGILPDLEVRQSAENNRAGVDAVMERARRWILEEIP